MVDDIVKLENDMNNEIITRESIEKVTELYSVI